MRNEDQLYMRAANRLARRGINRLSYEPLIGAVVVAGERVVGRGFAGEHQSAAVNVALDEAGALAAGATLYTNITPCPSAEDEGACLRRLIESRVARVVVGITAERDQASKKSGDILTRLRSERIEVETGVCEQACREVNEKYLKYSATGLPFVTVKFAQSLDGRVATATGDSQWVSSSRARRFAHQLRREHDAILVGIGTVLADDPQLTVRLVRGRDPLRIVIDSSLRIPLTARVLVGGASKHTLVVTSTAAEPARARAIEETGARVLRVRALSGDSGVNLAQLFEELGKQGIGSVLVEGGKAIVTSLFKIHAVDRLVAIIAPKIIGQGTDAIGDLGITKLDEALTFASVKLRKLGPDIIFDGRFK
jgi:diaminohydroxyphosphoribosylaminopyrimidine deaminase/5-amino-6-(5-phosphoribosylamino)uracil reductase